MMNICIEDKRHTGAASLRGDRRRIVALQQKLLTLQQQQQQPRIASVEIAAYLTAIHTRIQPPSSSSSSSSLHSIVNTSIDETTSSTSMSSLVVADVPPMFFESSFSLCDRNTFDYCNGVQIPTLARWLDQVESRLLQRLAQRAPQLFVALARVDELRELATHSAAQARTLESLLEQLQRQEPAVRVLRAHLRHVRARQLERQLGLLAELRHTAPMLDMLLVANDYAAALDLIDTALRIIDSELGGVQALHGTRAHLLQAAQTIDERMRRQFLDELCFAPPAADAAERHAPMLLVLARSGRLVTALHEFAELAQARAEAQVEALGGWKRVDSLDDDAFDDALARALALLTTAIGGALGVHAVVSAALRVHNGGDAVDAALAATAAVQASASAMVARALTARAERHRHAPLATFVRIHDRCHQFASANAPASRALVATLQTQARAFVDAFHSSRRASLQLLLESELWAPCAVPAQTWTSADASRMYVGERSFLCTNAVLMLLGMIDAYVQCAAALPSMAGEVAARAPQLVRQFNEQTCALVLGAGAARLLKLRTINARHLALALQSVELVLTLLPDIGRRLLAPLDTSRAALATPPLQALQRDLAAHCNQIDAKFGALLQERVALYLIGQLTLDVLADDCTSLVKKLTRSLDEVARKRALHAIATAVRPMLSANDPFMNVLDALG
jgi:hypothetical protein